MRGSSTTPGRFTPSPPPSPPQSRGRGSQKVRPNHGPVPRQDSARLRRAVRLKIGPAAEGLVAVAAMEFVDARRIERFTGSQPAGRALRHC